VGALTIMSDIRGNSNYDEDVVLRPRLRHDLKISRMKQVDRINYVVKDPLKDQFFRFDHEEWKIIELFDSRSTMQEMVEKFNSSHTLDPIDLQTVEDFKGSLDEMNLLEKSKKDTNVMLVEKMKESRKSQLLAKKGSLMYKRFPVIDPDKLFDKYIDKIWWIWTRGFVIFSSLIMLGAVIIILSHWSEFESGMRDLFSFNQMSFVNMVILWVTIYATIAIHEFGHGLTCKRYGGEVHEIGFLLLFFQPCLYCNVNDAWLFDKKWKQIMVTIAGGYIEFFIGSICAYIWWLTNPNTMIHLVSFQVMTICSISTVLFNFNPLIKLDGYYLFSDLTGVPNLKVDSFDYLKYLTKRYLFGMPEEDYAATTRDKKILLGYAICSFFWMVGLLTGLFKMAQGLLIDYFYGTGFLISLWVGWKIFGGYVTSSGKFLATWYMRNISFFQKKRNRLLMGIAFFFGLMLLAIPVNYNIYGDCSLDPEFTRVVRAQASGKMVEIYKLDGNLVGPGDKIARIENISLPYDRKITDWKVKKLEAKLRKSLVEDRAQVDNLRKEIAAEKMSLKQKDLQLSSLLLKYSERDKGRAILSFNQQLRRLNSYFKEGDEIFKVLGIERLKAVVEIGEQEIRFVKSGQPLKFKLHAKPYTTYQGTVEKIRQISISDPTNPKLKKYLAEIEVTNPGDLRPGMAGKAKIIGRRLPMVQLIGVKLAGVLRMDLFF